MDSKKLNLEGHKKRIVFLDALRGIAALTVVYFHYATNFVNHYTDNTFPQDYRIIYRFGGAGVELFFIISGFVIFMTLERSKRIQDFIISRISRLFPAYWFAILLTSISLIVFPLIDVKKLTLAQTLVNLTMFHTWIGLPSVDAVYWTLGLELVFYLFMAILYLLKIYKEASGKVFIFFNALFLIQLAIKIYPEITTYLHSTSLTVLLDFITLDGYGSIFLAGMLFYTGYKATFTKQILFQLLICLVQYEVLMYNVHPAHTFVTPVFFILFYYCCIGKSKYLENNILIFLGSISYSLYLIHAYIGYGLARFLFNSGVNNIVTQLLTFSIIIGVSWLMNKYIEVPYSVKLKNLLSKFNKQT